MKAVVVLSPGKVTIKEVPEPEPGPYEALVKVKSCAFCNGTDLHIINESSFYPLILGHEGCGEAIFLGEKVRYIKIGDRFIRPDSKQQYGPYVSTYGNMAEFALAIDRKAMKEDGFSEKEMPSEQNCGAIPKKISFENGSVILSLLECFSAIHNFDFLPGMDVLIFGAGPMGLGMTYFLLNNDNTVFLADVNEARLDYAKKHFPLVNTVNVSDKSITQFLTGIRFDMVLDLVGNLSILLDGSNYLKSGGKLCSMGVLRKDHALLDITKLQNNTSLHMLNYPVGRLNYMKPLLTMIKNKKLKPELFYSHVMPAENINEGIDLIKNKKALKVVFTF